MSLLDSLKTVVKSTVCVGDRETFSYCESKCYNTVIKPASNYGIFVTLFQVLWVPKDMFKLLASPHGGLWRTVLKTLKSNFESKL